MQITVTEPKPQYLMTLTQEELQIVELALYKDCPPKVEGGRDLAGENYAIFSAVSDKMGKLGIVKLRPMYDDE